MGTGECQQPLLTRVLNARTGNTGVWLMNRIRVLGLSGKQDAASGQFVYRAELSNNMFRNYPVVASMNMPSDIIIFVAGDSIGHANDFAPLFETSDQATLHMEDTTPLPVVDGVGTVAQPVRSMFQTDSIAIKMTLGLDWRIYRQGGIQVLTGVDW